MGPIYSDLFLISIKQTLKVRFRSRLKIIKLINYLLRTKNFHFPIQIHISNSVLVLKGVHLMHTCLPPDTIFP